MENFYIIGGVVIILLGLYYIFYKKKRKCEPLVGKVINITPSDVPQNEDVTTIYRVNVTTINWVDAPSACLEDYMIDLKLYTLDNIIIPGSTILYVDRELKTTYNGNDLYHITSYNGIHYILINSIGLVNEYGSCKKLIEYNH